MKKDFLKLADWTKDEIVDLLNLADQLKYEQKHGISHKHLEGKTLGMIFNKASTRTRISFEVGMHQLGGLGIFLSSADMQMGRGEPVKDTARVLSRYLDGIMIRTYEQKEVEELANYASIPVINGLTDDFHPCQVMADLMTIREKKTKLEGLKIAYIGDGNNMANSLIVGSLKMDMHISIASPKGYEPDSEIIDTKDDKLLITNSVEEAIKNADVVMTDVWASMGQEKEQEERKKVFKDYQINSENMKLAKKDAMVLHCLPAHRGEEITGEVLEENAENIFEEAENRLHVQKAILVKLMV